MVSSCTIFSRDSHFICSIALAISSLESQITNNQLWFKGHREGNDFLSFLTFCLLDVCKIKHTLVHKMHRSYVYSLTNYCKANPWASCAHGKKWPTPRRTTHVPSLSHFPYHTCFLPVESLLPDFIVIISLICYMVLLPKYASLNTIVYLSLFLNL